MVGYFFCIIFVLSITTKNKTMKKFYYTIEKQLHSYDNVQETSGWKYVNIYSIENNTPKLVGNLDILNETNTEVAIAEKLEKEGLAGTGLIHLIQL